MTVDLAARARHWAILLTHEPSESGSPDEASFGPWLAETLRDAGTFGAAEAWSFPVAPDDLRHCVAMLLRGSGRETVVLTGHYDTVTTEDFGDLRVLATRPEALLPALQERLSRIASTPADLLAQQDFASGGYLPGRGLLDMKAGLAAGLAVAERFAAESLPGNLLFIAVPDEEVSSVGARAAAPELAAIAQRYALDIVAAINLDAIADNGDGSAGRSIATGTVGKLLPTAFVAGVPAHSGFPFNGINAGVLLAAIVARMEWAAELTDMTAATPGTPPSLLSLRDGKSGYDVTTPATAFASWNVLTHRRTPAETLAAFEALCREATEEALRSLAGRGPVAAREVAVIRYADLIEEARRRRPEIDSLIAEMSLAWLEPLPERCRRVTGLVWAASGRAGPAVVVGFGSIPYLATALSASPAATRLRRALEAAAAAAAEPVAIAEYFAGISDMSFFGEADPAVLGVVADNTPLWRQEVRWPAAGMPARIPTINIGPWGRDYHTPLERLHTGYAFATLPRLLCTVVDGVLGGHAS